MNQKGPVRRSFNEVGLAPIIIVIIVAAIAGAFYLGKQSAKTSPTTQPSPTPVSTSKDETANWKTYTNDGLTFKYPADGKLTEGGYYSVDGVFVKQANLISLLFNVDKEEALNLGKDGSQLSITTDENKNRASLESFKAEFINQNVQSTLLDDQPALRGETGGPYGNETIITIKNGLIYRLTFEPGISKTADQILSTFRFLP